MKRFAYVLLTTLEALVVFGALALHHFTRAKMGVARTVVFVNAQLREVVPLEALVVGLVVAGVAVAVVALLVSRASWAGGARRGVMPGACVLLSLLLVVFSLVSSVRSTRAYYLMVILLFVATLLQSVKLMVTGGRGRAHGQGA